MKKVLICSLIILSLVGCGKKKEVKETDAIKFKKEYEKLNDSYQKISIKERNPIIYSNLDKIYDVMDNGAGLIYLGYPESSSCRDNINILIDATKQTGLKKVYYLNTKDIDVNDSKYDKLKKYINDFKGFNLIFVKDKDNIGAIEESDENYKKKTSDEKEQLLKIYRNSIHEMLDDLCDESC